jgi:hypothetical protein
MTQLSIIIPVSEFNDTVKEYLAKAIKSVADQDNAPDKPQLVVVFPPKAAQVIFFVKELNLENVVKFITTTDAAADYQSQINWAVNEIDTEYFSVLEFDDELGKTYVKNATQYAAAYPLVDIFILMMLEVDTENKPVKISNEIAWSQHFAGDIENLGYLSVETVKSYSDFKLSGAVIKKSDFVKNGGYKVNIKLTFMFEYLLRSLNNNSKAFIIPKIIYKHLVDRPDSMFEVYSKTMPKLERKFWFDIAMKEYFFNKDRELNLSSIS